LDMGARLTIDQYYLSANVGFSLNWSRPPRQARKNFLDFLFLHPQFSISLPIAFCISLGEGW
jgi:hypothetical protein